MPHNGFSVAIVVVGVALVVVCGEGVGAFVAVSISVDYAMHLCNEATSLLDDLIIMILALSPCLEG